jgi:hypothetical protein
MNPYFPKLGNLFGSCDSRAATMKTSKNRILNFRSLVIFATPVSEILEHQVGVLLLAAAKKNLALSEVSLWQKDSYAMIHLESMRFVTDCLAFSLTVLKLAQKSAYLFD